MNLKRKIKNCKRHKQNKKLSIFAEAMFNTSWKAPEFDILIHPLIFEIIRFNHFGEICGNLRPSEFIDNPFSYLLDTESLYKIPRSISVPNDIMEFYNDNETKWLKEWCGIPSASEPLYLHIDKPIPSKPSVSIKEI